MTTSTRETGSHRKHAAIWAGLTVGLSLILLALLMLFISPSLLSGPRDLGLGIVGTQEDSDRVSAALDAQQPGAFLLQPYQSAADLQQGVRDREIVGGLDFSDPEDLQVYVASAGSTAVSATVSSAGATMAGSMGQTADVIDVVPLPSGDPTGVGIGGLAFPLVFGGIVPAVAFRSMLAGKRWWIFAGLTGFSVAGGFVVAAVLKYLFGSIEGPLVPVAASVALGIAALALPLAGLNECFGTKGFTIAAMSMMFVGNPFAGIATGAQWLPAGVAMIGQLLPPGAAGTLVRAVAYFDGAGGGAAALTLGVWVLMGVVLWFAGPRIKDAKTGKAAVLQQA
ncbi:hypothetical protein [Arthrobacter caoxuetaonis]|uniref:ABC transporter permease n=1 Tax=Arthrobacter caoxuetaonis TaxID=2886935 RepID=A0A9X1MC81_9MICC|nr:hypothetical protein [Arthrobacter caoxuetaonis]MCC3296660.1 hypothetical protein [Arthrobacter caoxuetaonis]USQ56514.1 hypothetical protein NF551_12260 [Arthrobacter caoxuetaonis]